MSGTYLEGQVPAKCGHYYPDVLRVRDENLQDGRFVRILDCEYCGRLEKVTKRFGAVTAVERVSLKIPRGAFTTSARHNGGRLL